MSESFEEAVATAATETHTPLVVSGSQDASLSANIDWKDNALYYQTGKKQGQLKAGAHAKKSLEFAGLNLDELKSTPSQAIPALDVVKDKKAIKAEKQIVEAKIAAKFVMRILDILTGWISGGTFGEKFSAHEKQQRNIYRDELEKNWEDYLVTLDIPMHPAIIVTLGSMIYVGEAFKTEKGAARAQSFKDKFISKVAISMFGGKKNAAKS
jgi:hypothetical protein